MSHLLRPTPNQYGRVPGTSEPAFAIQQLPPQSIPLQTIPSHLPANPPRPMNTRQLHQHNANYSKQASQQYDSSPPPNETAWRTSHPVSMSVSSKPAQTSYSVPNQPQQAQKLAQEQYADSSPQPAQRLIVKAASSPRSVSQPNTRSNHLHKPSTELLRPRHASPDTSPRESPRGSLVGSRGRSVSLVPPNFVELGGAPAVPQSPVLNSPVSPSYSDGGSQGQDSTGRRRISWISGGRSRHASQDISGAAYRLGAWYYGEPNIEYNTRLLENAQKVSFSDFIITNRINALHPGTRALA
jgi:hypothetical protein